MNTFFSPAKINWFLHVTGRRADGFHTLETVFQRIDWCDELTIEIRADGQIHLTGNLSGVAAEKNLAHRAAMTLKSFAQQHGVDTTRLGADIHLRKNIPAGAGLGGGSSNAATVLLALNRLWDLNLPNAQLQKIGLTLGADVPFFVSEYPAAFARGVGEELQVLDLPARALLLVNPNVHVNTGAVFTHPDLPRDHAPLSLSTLELQHELRDNPLQASHSNDLEAVTFSIAPEVKAVHATLQTIAPTRMSGSGATVIACPMDAAQHDALLAWVKQAPANWQCRWVSTITEDSHENLLDSQPST